MDLFFQQLSSIPFAGGGFNDVAIAEGLAEALKMFSKGKQNQNMNGQRHCILVAASNPYTLPTPVYRPQPQHIGQSDHAETPADYHLSDAETLAKSFAQGKSNPQVADPPGGNNVKNPHFLVLISDNFMEAHAALSRSNQNHVTMEVGPAPPISGPPLASVPPGMSQSVQPGMQPVGMSGNSSVTNMAINQQTSSAMQAGIPKLVKVWEGKLTLRHEGQLLFIASLEMHLMCEGRSYRLVIWVFSSGVHTVTFPDIADYSFRHATPFDRKASPQGSSHCEHNIVNIYSSSSKLSNRCSSNHFSRCGSNTSPANPAATAPHADATMNRSKFLDFNNSPRDGWYHYESNLYARSGMISRTAKHSFFEKKGIFGGPGGTFMG